MALNIRRACTALGAVLGLVVAPVFTGAASAAPWTAPQPYTASQNVAIIGGQSVTSGGYFNTAEPQLSAFTFTTMTASQVTAVNLEPFDTAMLNMHGTLACNANSLSAQAKTDLVDFLAHGKKLIIYDSECGAVDYSWLPYPFTTNNPGQLGAHGTLSIDENNTLSSNVAGDPYYIDAAHLGSNTDAVGDMNVMTTMDPAWKRDMSGTNALSGNGPVHTYAEYPTTGGTRGLIIYNGLDLDYLNTGLPYSTELFKIWKFELMQPFNPSGLPGTVPVVTDAPPVVASDHATVTVSEGTAAGNTGTFSDPDGDPVTLSASVGTVADTGSGTWAWSYTPGDGPADAQTVTITATANGLSSTTTFELGVDNVAPTTTALTPNTSNVLSGQPVTFTGTATDPSAADTTAGFSWAFDGGTYGSSNSYTTQFSSCGSHTVSALAKDKDDGVSASFTSDAVVATDSSFLSPLTPGVFNKVQKGRVVPVKISAGCAGVFASGLHPAIQLLSGDVDPATDPGDGSLDLTTTSVSSADTTGIMREADGQYIYNLQVPSAASGTKYTVRVRPFGTAAGGSLYVVLQIK